MGLFGPPNVQKMEARGDVDGLVKALGYWKDRQVPRAAAVALGKIGDARAVEPLIAALKAVNWGMREAVAQALGQIGDARAVEPLIAALDYSHEGALKAAVGALDKIGDVRAVEPLVAALKKRTVREAVAVILKKIGEPAVEPLIGALKDSEGEVREAAAGVLDALDWKPGNDEYGAWYWITKREWDRCEALGLPAVEPLITTLKDSEKNIREAAAAALEKFGGYAVGPLIGLLGDSHAREIATAALEKIGEPAIEPLMAALKDSSWDVRKAVVAALDALGWKPSDDESGAWYWITKGELGRCEALGLTAVEPLIAALKDKSFYTYDWNMRQATVQMLGQIGGARSVEPLIAALKDKAFYSPTVAQALGQIGDARAVEPLIAALKDKERLVREAAVDALVQIGDARAVEPLIAALRDREWLMHEPVTGALDALGWKPGRDASGAWYWIAKKEWDKCEASGASAVEPLIAALKDSRWDVRKAAARVLLKLFNSNTLDDSHKQLILRQRETISNDHDDQRNYSYQSDCHEDQGIHTDSGIEVEFPA